MGEITNAGERIVLVEGTLPPPRKWTNDIIEAIRDTIRPINTGPKIDIVKIGIAGMIVLGVILLLKRRGK